MSLLAATLTFIGRYAVNLLVALDQFLNTILLGDPDETLSSRAAKGAHRWHWRTLGNLLELVDPGHLKRVIEEDEGKNALRPSVRAQAPLKEGD